MGLSGNKIYPTQGNPDRRIIRNYITFYNNHFLGTHFSWQTHLRGSWMCVNVTLGFVLAKHKVKQIQAQTYPECVSGRRPTEIIKKMVQDGCGSECLTWDWILAHTSTESFYLCALMPWLFGYLSHRLLIPGQCSWLKTHNFIVRRVSPQSWIYVPITSYIHQLCLPTYGLKGAPCKTPNLIVIPWLQMQIATRNVATVWLKSLSAP